MEIKYGNIGKVGILKRYWLPLLIAVPASLMAVALGLRFWTGSFGDSKLNPIYRYHFSRPDQGSITQDLDREIAFYQQRISHDPDGGMNRALLAKAYLRMAKATGEVSWYLLAQQTAQESLAKLSFQNDGAMVALARVATAKHDFAQAIRLAKQIRGVDEALSILVVANLATGKLKEANQAAKALVDNNPNLTSLSLDALVKVGLGKDTEAIQDFQRALAAEEAEETGSSIWARTILGRLYFKRGQLKLAEQLYRESLRVLPQYPPAVLNLAELEVRQAHYQAAENLYSQFFLTSRRSPTVYDHIVMRGMARVKELEGNSSEAQNWRNKAEARLRFDLTSFGHRRELARLLLERGRPQDLTEALSLMQQEVKIRRDAETLDTFAWTLTLLGRWSEAQKYMQEALHWGVRDPIIFYRAGTIEQKLGNQEKAQAYFRQAQETDPTFDENARRAFGLGVGLLGLN